MSEDDKKIREFRNKLRKIKQSVLNTVTYKSQNTKELSKVIKQLIQFYTLLRPVIFDRKPISSLPIPELQQLFTGILDIERSTEYQMELEYYLKRDFIDFPFTLDEEQIDNIPVENNIPIIIPNNISLTEIDE